MTSEMQPVADPAIPLRKPNSARRKSVPEATCRSLPRGPTSSPHGDFGAFGTAFPSSPARPASTVLFAKRPALSASCEERHSDRHCLDAIPQKIPAVALGVVVVVLAAVDVGDVV